MANKMVIGRQAVMSFREVQYRSAAAARTRRLRVDVTELELEEAWLKAWRESIFDLPAIARPAGWSTLIGCISDRLRQLDGLLAFYR